MLGGFGSTGEQPSLAPDLESEALSLDAGDGRVEMDASSIAAVSMLSPAQALSQLPKVRVEVRIIAPHS